MTELGAVTHYARGLAMNVAAGTRLAVFLPVRAHHFRVSPVDYAVLICFNFSVWVAVAWLRAGSGGGFDPNALPAYLSAVMLVLAAALLAALAYHAMERVLLFAVALSAGDLIFELAGALLPAIAAAVGLPGAVVAVFVAWTWAVSVRAMAVCGGVARPQFLQAVFAMTAMIGVAYHALPRSDVWLPPSAEAAAPGLEDEQLFHLQGQLIERDLASIEPGQPGVPELYFVGFAPDASQDVFLKELRFTKGLFDERLGTAGRSIALASSQSALHQVPIASATNLSRALVRTGEKMNPEEDVLVLFVTAHGDREHRISAVQPPLSLAQLTPTSLSRMLQETAVKWRVIVVSACYAGGFIEPLRDENSVIITAAAADRTSFGCETGRDFTYFGEAYFRDALAKTRSFTKAFEIAKDIVAKREAQEKLTPSQPQIWIGSAIAERLKHFAD